MQNMYTLISIFKKKGLKDIFILINFHFILVKLVYYYIKVVSHDSNNSAGRQEVDCRLLRFYPLIQRGALTAIVTHKSWRVCAVCNYLLEVTMALYWPQETLASIPISHCKASPKSCQPSDVRKHTTLLGKRSRVWYLLWYACGRMSDTPERGL